MSKIDEATAYSCNEARAYDEKRFKSPSGRRIHKAEVDLVFWMLKHVPSGHRVLEVGCGTGRILTEVIEAGYCVDGADASPYMLDMLRKKVGPGQLAKAGTDCELTVCGAANLPMPDDSYDAVYSVRLLNQTESPDYALRVVGEMVRVTKPGGYTLVEFVNAYRPRWGAARRKTTRLRPAEVIARGLDAGARIVGVRGAFLLSMQAYAYCPKALLAFLNCADRVLSRALPRLCSRTYVLFQKSTSL